jgi:hypothetical protein
MIRISPAGIVASLSCFRLEQPSLRDLILLRGGYPGLKSWAIFCRPNGTGFCCVGVPRTEVLGYFLSSQRDLILLRGGTQD